MRITRPIRRDLPSEILGLPTAANSWNQNSGATNGRESITASLGRKRLLAPATNSARIGLLAQANPAALKIRKDALTNFFLFTRMMPLPGGSVGCWGPRNL